MGSTERRLSSLVVAAETDDDDFETILNSIGFGRWQALSVVMVLIIAGLMPIQMLGVTLLAPPLPFRCYSEPYTVENQSLESYNSSWFDIFEMESPNMTYFNERCLNSSAQDSNLWVPQNNNTLKTNLKSCPIIEYDMSIFSSSIVSDFHLVCEKFNMQALYQITYTIGGIIGSVVGGHIGDMWGRRKAVQLGAVLYLAAVVCMTTVPYYEVILTMRILLGFANTSTLVTGWNMVVESAPAKPRTLLGMLMGLPYSVFMLLLAMFGYFIRTWQNLTLACSFPAIILLPLSFIVDESPRWLLQQNRSIEALLILQRAIKLNNANVNDNLPAIVEKIVQKNKEKRPEKSNETTSISVKFRNSCQEMMKYIRSPGMRIILIVTPSIWFFQSFVYLGLAINANNFSSNNPFLYVALTGAMDGASILLSTPVTPFIGRRVMVGVELFVGGCLLLLELLIPIEYFWLKWILVMIGFLLVAGAFQVNFLYAPELFPTQARARGFAFVNTAGNIGFMCAPLITTNLAKVNRWAPGVVFGSCGILASLLTVFLPETLKRPLPETIQDVDDRWRENKIGSKSSARGIENLAYKYDVEHNVSPVKNETVCKNETVY